MHWLDAVQRLRRDRHPGVLVTLASVRGHAPRAAGAKMVVTTDAAWDSIGGGNLEATAVARARELLAGGVTTPEQLTVSLTDRARTEHGRQCCGGEVDVLLEPLLVVPSVAIFGLGHVGLELARILARHDLELHLVDSRAEQLVPARLAVLDDAVARVHVHHAVLPELVLGEVASGTHVLVMTHDHAEDAALCDARPALCAPGHHRPDRQLDQGEPVPPRPRVRRPLGGGRGPHPHADRPARAGRQGPGDDRGVGGRRAAGDPRGGAGVGGPPPGPSRSHDALRPRAGPSARRGTSTGDGRGAGFQRNPAPRHPRCG